MKATVVKKAPGGRFFRDLSAEMRKVNWPTWKETLTYFTVVMFTLIFFVVVFLAFDSLMLNTFFPWLIGGK
ncbi:MAG: preprotein translocase subunit SecE [Bacillota bacterium]